MSDIMKDAIKMEETTKRLSEKVIGLLKEQYPDMSPRIIVNIKNGKNGKPVIGLVTVIKAKNNAAKNNE